MDFHFSQLDKLFSIKAGSNEDLDGCQHLNSWRERDRERERESERERERERVRKTDRKTYRNNQTEAERRCLNRQGGDGRNKEL